MKHLLWSYEPTVARGLGVAGGPHFEILTSFVGEPTNWDQQHAIASNAVAYKGAGDMPITPFLGDVKVDPETRRAMGVAFEIVCTALNVRAPDDMLKPVIARKIIALAQSGERDANRLGEFALIDLRKGS